jgi:hypothetical protein
MLALFCLLYPGDDKVPQVFIAASGEKQAKILFDMC